MVYHVVSTANEDEVALENPGRMIFEVEGVVISNPGTAAATVTLKDVVGSNEETLISLSVAAGGKEELPNLRGSKVYGNLVVNSSAAGVEVYVGVKEV